MSTSILELVSKSILSYSKFGLLEIFFHLNDKAERCEIVSIAHPSIDSNKLFFTVEETSLEKKVGIRRAKDSCNLAVIFHKLDGPDFVARLIYLALDGTDLLIHAKSHNLLQAKTSAFLALEDF